MKLPKIIGEHWFNSPPLTTDLKGQVVLADFWTYSCVNCLRTLPYLKKWWEKYQDKGFLLIGIHTPEFDFEKEPVNVEKAVKELGIEWPVVMDNEYKNWNNFANHYWPAKYLADREGNIIYTHFGEGDYGQTESFIQSLLGTNLDRIPLLEQEEHEHGSVCFIPTPETYCGYARGFLANKGGYQEDKEAYYEVKEELPENSIALNGQFLASGEYVESRQSGSTLFLRFKATEVNLVLKTVSPKAVVGVTLNTQKIPSSLRGKDVNQEGEVVITEPKMYNLLKSKDLVEGLLSIKAKEGNFQAYAFTFSGCLS